jgi:hypothetical protein
MESGHRMDGFQLNWLWEDIAATCRVEEHRMCDLRIFASGVAG